MLTNSSYTNARKIVLFLTVFLTGCSYDYLLNKPVNSTRGDDPRVSYHDFKHTTGVTSDASQYGRATLRVGCISHDGEGPEYLVGLYPSGTRDEIKQVPAVAIAFVDDYVAALASNDEEERLRILDGFYWIKFQFILSSFFASHIEHGDILEIILLFKDKTKQKYTVDLSAIRNKNVQLRKQCHANADSEFGAPEFFSIEDFQELREGAQKKSELQEIFRKKGILI